MVLRVTGGDVCVTVQGGAVGEAEGVLGRLTADGVPQALMAGNASLWGPGAAEEAAGRLGWVHSPARSRRLLPRLAQLAGRFTGLDHVVLTGTGGAALAAQVIADGGAGLTLLDTPDPQAVRRALAADPALGRTLLVVTGRESVETDAVRRVFEAAFRDAAIDPDDRIVVVSPPGATRETPYEVITADPEVAGCYGALSAYGLAPAALCGADPARLLDEAEALAPALALPYDNPGLALGAALGTSVANGRDKLLMADNASGLRGFLGWAEQLVAESTGKDGTGILPVVVEGPAAPGFGSGADVRRLVLGERAEDVGIAVSGSLGAQFLLWEYAVAVACRIIGVSPFARPAVDEAEEAVAGLLRGTDEGAAPTIIAREPVLVDGEVEVHGPPELLDGAKDLRGVADALMYALPPRGYLAVMAYLDPADGAGALRALLAEQAADARDAQVTFGWGPRLLHSTGQFHKDGPPTGVFLQITGAPDDDLDVPGRPYSLGTLQLAQAFADLRALRSRGLPALRLHLRDRSAGLARLRSALSD